ncbi:CHAT domain-containing protein [Actinoplanes xinjiangensis]|uniref:CHAT domain-containing protein n=1 Tax=Actinoplanes xinjiangensis TaxID=512350 RepID=A0A316EKG0_9ACTN|nr:CHAT domain-containing protein [Actinoplanes xinjiangensis]PWK31073.1 hypothetical protein BC793_13570 [Actinoplanes xinjiangensis]GIF44155.1 hypothetical protein Axi01nite_84660 [Actinoplanes xinjiangensis]
MTTNRVAGALKGLTAPAPLAPVAAERTAGARPAAPPGDEIGIAVPAAAPDLSERLPEDVALLKVIAVDDVPGRYRFRLEGYFRGRVWSTDESDESAHLRPGLTIDGALEAGDDTALDAAVEYYEFIMAWSSTKHALREWLTRLHRTVGAFHRLIIWDDTDTGIPWELLRLTFGDEHLWLGADFEVTRWTTIHDTGRHHQFSARDEQVRSGGEILCYEDRDLVSRAGLSISSVAACSSRETLVALLRDLDLEERRFGLVYVRAHGEYGADLRSAKLGGISLSRFETLRLRAMRASGSVVMLNACNSARPVFDPAMGDRANRNFAEVFLRRHARAVLATMGEVPTGSSAALARRMIVLARSGGVRIPEFLRQHRAGSARGLPADTLTLDAEQREAIRDFLYASRYVYFGHPDAVFVLGEPS